MLIILTSSVVSGVTANKPTPQWEYLIIFSRKFCRCYTLFLHQRLWHYRLLLSIFLIEKTLSTICRVRLLGFALNSLSFWYDYRACTNSLRVVESTANVWWLMTSVASVFHHREQTRCISVIQKYKRTAIAFSNTGSSMVQTHLSFWKQTISGMLSLLTLHNGVAHTCYVSVGLWLHNDLTLVSDCRSLTHTNTTLIHTVGPPFALNTASILQGMTWDSGPGWDDCITQFLQSFQVVFYNVNLLSHSEGMLLNWGDWEGQRGTHCETSLRWRLVLYQVERSH